MVVTEPACPSYVSRSAREAGSAVFAAEAGKIDKYKPLADLDGATMVPLAFETTGRRGEVLEAFLSQMAETSSAAGPSLSSLYLQLSVTLAKMNVAVAREAVRHATGVRALSGRRVSFFNRRAPAA